MSTITQQISSFPTPLPNRETDTEVDFSDHTDSFLSTINNHVTQENTWAGQANVMSAEANDNAQAAEDDATTARQYRLETQAAQSATAYDNGVTYDYPDTVICSNGHAYRCIGTGVVGDNPITSVSGDWQQITVDAEQDLREAFLL